MQTSNFFFSSLSISSLKVKADVEVRKRIELIQDFEMPAISDRLKVTASNAKSSVFFWQFQDNNDDSF